jgi:hypothetical protein
MEIASPPSVHTAGEILKWLYGPLNENVGTLSGCLLGLGYCKFCSPNNNV